MKAQPAILSLPLALAAVLLPSPGLSAQITGSGFPWPNGGIHGQAVIIDPAPPAPEERFRMIFFLETRNGNRLSRRLTCAHSADGKHWRPYASRPAASARSLAAPSTRKSAVSACSTPGNSQCSYRTVQRMSEAFRARCQISPPGGECYAIP